jgi:hypothetical protein
MEGLTRETQESESRAIGVVVQESRDHITAEKESKEQANHPRNEGLTRETQESSRAVGVVQDSRDHTAEQESKEQAINHPNDDSLEGSSSLPLQDAVVDNETEKGEDDSNLDATGGSIEQVR